MLEGNRYVNLKRLLNLYGELFVREYRKRLKADGTYASGRASRSLEYGVTIGQLQSELSVLGERYITAISDGRGKNKKMPPSTAILRWMKDKGVRLRDSKGRFAVLSDYKMRGIAYAIARSIGREGTIKRFNNTGTGLPLTPLSEVSFLSIVVRTISCNRTIIFVFFWHCLCELSQSLAWYI